MTDDTNTTYTTEQIKMRENGQSIPIEPIVREYFPDITEREIGYILWNHTGYPCFWDGDAETCLRRQLAEFKALTESESQS